jgi:hypothetical protein
MPPTCVCARVVCRVCGNRYVLGKVTGLQSHFEVSDSTLPPNKSGYALADGMAKAWELYGDKKYPSPPRALV